MRYIDQIKTKIFKESTYTDEYGIEYLYVTDDTIRKAEAMMTLSGRSDLYVKHKGKYYSFGKSKRTIDTTKVTDMSGLFKDNDSFNADIGHWNTANVKDMGHMFHGAHDFNQYIGDWDTSNVVNMHSMFLGANSFNQDISSWNVSNVVDMSYMFLFASVFNQDLTVWDIQNVTWNGSFKKCTALPKDQWPDFR